MLKFYKPHSPGTRSLVQVDRSNLWVGKPYKALLSKVKSSKGRNNYGRITAWKKGGGHKKRYRNVDFKFLPSENSKGTVMRVEYDPFRSSYIVLVDFKGEKKYILAPHKIKIGDVIQSADKTSVKYGNRMLLSNIPVGTIVHCIELKHNAGAIIARAAGSYAQVLGRDGDKVSLRLRSGEIRLVHSNCRASIGVVSNPDHQNISLGKAGRNRWKGIRPTVRGVAMNPIDHPHGGGEGKTGGGRNPVTPWGVATKGKRTRKRENKLIIKRRFQ